VDWVGRVSTCKLMVFRFPHVFPTDLTGFDCGWIMRVGEAGVMAEAVTADAEPGLPGATAPEPNGRGFSTPVILHAKALFFDGAWATLS
jgi:hypothetical protein